MSLKLAFFLLVIFSFSVQNLKYGEYMLDKTMIKNILRNLQENRSSLNNFDLIFKIVQLAFNFTEYNDLYLIYSENFGKCVYSGILEHLNGGDMIETCVLASGKTLNDFGNEFECDSTFQSASQYLTLHFKFTSFKEIAKNESINILKFLENYHSYIGLCIPKKCVNAVKELVKHQPLLNIIYSKSYITDFKVNVIKEIEKESESEPNNGLYIFILYFFLFYNLLKIIIGTIRLVWMNKGYNQYYVSKLNKGKRGTIASISQSRDSEEKIEQEEEKENKKEEKENIEEENGDKKYKSEFNNDLNQSSLLNLKFNNNDDFFSFYNKSINGTFTDETNLYNPFVDMEKEFPNWLKIMKSLDLFDNVNILCILSNRYYNSFQIKRLYIIRFGLMIMCIIYQIVYSQMDLPYRYYIKNDFYKSFFFIIVKFSINSSTFWITLDAVFVGFKMMCFMKKEKRISGNIKFLGLVKFLLLIIPKFIIFFLAFVLLHIFSDNLTFEICKKGKVLSSYLYYKDTIYNRTFDVRDTENNFWKLYKNFIPFRLNYIDFIKEEKNGLIYFNNTKQNEIDDNNDENEINTNTSNNSNNISNISSNIVKIYKSDASREIPSPFLTNTELFVNVYFNEFYLLIIMIIITYYSYILRNKIFDYTILGINIFLYFLPLLDKVINKHLEITDEDGEKIYSLRYVLGQNYTEKYTHFFINFYYFGFLIGVMKFYLDENLFNQKKRKHEKEDLKLGFEFCQKTIIFLNKIKLRYKRIFLLLSLLALVLISSSFYFIQLSSSEDFKYEMTDSLYYLFIYEKNFCGIFFFTFLIMFILYPKNTNIIELSETNGFIILERISFVFFCSFKYLIYSQFCVFIIYIKISYMNLLLNTFGMFLIIFGFSVLTTTLIELPLRHLVKSFMNRNFEKKFEIYYNKNKEETDEYN